MAELATKSPVQESTARGIAFSVIGIFTMAIGDALSKLIGQDYGPIQIFVCRAVFTLPPVLILLWHEGGVRALRSRHPKLHAVRALLWLLSGIPFILSLQFLPLAEAIAITFTGPILVAALSVPVLGERVGMARWLAILAGFLGVLLIIRPGSSAFQPAALLPLLAAACHALAMLLARRLSREDSPGCLVFWQTVGSLGIAAFLLPFDWRTPQAGDWGLFALMGMVGAATMVLMVQSYRCAAAAVVAPFYYSIMLWSVLFGWLIWRELPDPWIWPGVGLLVASGLTIIYRETLPHRPTRTAAEKGGNGSDPRSPDSSAGGYDPMQDITDLARKRPK